MTRSYAETAYRGEPNPAPQLTENTTPAGGSRRLREQGGQAPLARLGPQCGEYLAGSQPGDQWCADSKSVCGGIHGKAQGHIWPTQHNPLVVLTIVGVCGWLFLGCSFFAVVVAMLGDPGFDFIFSKEGVWNALLFLGGPALIGLVPSIIKRKMPGVGNKGNIVFRRETGYVHPPRKVSEESFLFADFDAYIYESFRGSGNVGMKLMLAHRRLDFALLSLDEQVDETTAAQREWELVQHYMDVRYPLPDLPQYEPFRADDPVTAEWDRRRGRPPYWWRNISRHQFRALREAARDPCYDYPWGKTREQAKAEGWQPSIYSQVLFEEASYEDLMEFLAEADPTNADNIRAPEPSPVT